MKQLLNISDNRITLTSYSTQGGCAPYWSAATGTASVLEKLEEIKQVYNEDGTFNVTFPKAEDYALCLHHDGKEDAALELFELIAGNSDKLLQMLNGAFKMSANTIGQLGIEGLHVYAELLKKKGKKDVANKCLLEIVDNYPLRMGIRATDIAQEAIESILAEESYPPGKREHYSKLASQIGNDSY